MARKYKKPKDAAPGYASQWKSKGAAWAVQQLMDTAHIGRNAAINIIAPKYGVDAADLQFTRQTR